MNESMIHDTLYKKIYWRNLQKGSLNELVNGHISEPNQKIRVTGMIKNYFSRLHVVTSTTCSDISKTFPFYSDKYINNTHFQLFVSCLHSFIKKCGMCSGTSNRHLCFQLGREFTVNLSECM